MYSLLVGVDHSAASRRAVEFAVRRAIDYDCSLVIAHVINWSNYAFTTPEVNEARAKTKAKEIELAQEQLIDPLVAWAITEGGLPADRVSSVIRHGRPSEMMSRLVNRDRHELIVVGRTGESQIRDAFFGSTVNRLVQHAPVPVVVVP